MKAEGLEQARRAIRAEMARLNLATKDVAKAIGKSEGYVHNVICGCVATRGVRDSIEKFFNKPFWSQIKP